MNPEPAHLFEASVGAPEAPFHPPSFFAHKDRVARWSLLAVLVLGAAQVLTLLLVFWLAARPPWIATPDTGGILHGSDGILLPEAKRLQVEQSLLASQALLERNAFDFDWPELLEARFSRPALAAAAALKASEASEFRDKGISQKAHIRQIEALDTRPDKVLVAITGTLERHGQFQQQPFTEHLPFTLRLNFRLNPDVLGSRSHLLMVTDFQLTYEKAN